MLMDNEVKKVLEDALHELDSLDGLYVSDNEAMVEPWVLDTRKIVNEIEMVLGKTINLKQDKTACELIKKVLEPTGIRLDSELSTAKIRKNCDLIIVDDIETEGGNITDLKYEIEGNILKSHKEGDVTVVDKLEPTGVSLVDKNKGRQIK